MSTVNVTISGVASPVVPQTQETVDPYLLPLRTALRNTFQAHPVIVATDAASVEKNASIMSMYANVQVAFKSHIRKDVIRQMVAGVDVSDDTQLTDLQTQLLAVPEWTTDNSDVSA